jgi:hypothetical protein
MVYKPGNIIPESGVYAVTHEGDHHQPHDVTCIAGRKFPPCNTCGSHPLFVLRVAAIHVEDHRSFKR